MTHNLELDPNFVMVHSWPMVYANHNGTDILYCSDFIASVDLPVFRPILDLFKDGYGVYKADETGPQIVAGITDGIQRIVAALWDEVCSFDEPVSMISDISPMHQPPGSEVNVGALRSHRAYFVSPDGSHHGVAMLTVAAGLGAEQPHTWVTGSTGTPMYVCHSPQGETLGALPQWEQITHELNVVN